MGKRRIPKRLTVREGKHINYVITLTDGREVIVSPSLVHETDKRPWMSNPAYARLDGNILKPGPGFIKFAKVGDRYEIVEQD